MFIILISSDEIFSFPVSADSSTSAVETEQPYDNLLDKDKITGSWDVSPIKPVKNVLVTGINDTWALIKSPLGWDSTSFLVYTPVILATYFLMILDEPITAQLPDGRNKNSDLITWAEYYGRNRTSELTSAGLAAAGLILNDKKLIRIGLEIFESYWFANNIHSVVKRVFGRARPVEERGTYTFDPFAKRKNPLNSFPSGHATMAFSLSTVLASHTDNTWLKILAYIPAVLTCYSRVYQDYHWPSDVFLGAAIGYFTGRFVVNRHNNEAQNFFSLGVDERGRFSLVIPFN